MTVEGEARNGNKRAEDLIATPVIMALRFGAIIGIPVARIIEIINSEVGPKAVLPIVGGFAVLGAITGLANAGYKKKP